MHYSKEQMTRILDCPTLSARDRTFAALFIGCALRRMEAAGLKMRDVQLPVVTLPQEIVKGGKRQVNPSPGRTFTVPDAKALAILQAWCAFRRSQLAGDDEPFLPNPHGKHFSLRGVSWIWDEKIAPIVPENPNGTHAGRHSLGTVLLETKQATIRDIQRLLGHRDIVTTERVYAHDRCMLTTASIF